MAFKFHLPFSFLNYLLMYLFPLAFVKCLSRSRQALGTSGTDRQTLLLLHSHWLIGHLYPEPALPGPSASPDWWMCHQLSPVWDNPWVHRVCNLVCGIGKLTLLEQLLCPTVFIGHDVGEWHGFGALRIWNPKVNGGMKKQEFLYESSLKGTEQSNVETDVTRDTLLEKAQ